MERLEIRTFLDMAEEVPVVDVRSPSEYRRGHIPGAMNIPLFTDRERSIVGKTYKKKGRVPAVFEGLEAIGPRMRPVAEEAHRLARGGDLLLYCWRGGMRSESMAWLFEKTGIHCCLLNKGYKAYRRYIQQQLGVPRNMLIVGGMTGSGKTHILEVLAEQGQQVTDLEKLASHKGSAFGSLGMNQQPSSEHFAHLLYEDLKSYDPRRILWLEDESMSIGTVMIPEVFYHQMSGAPVIALEIERRHRIPLLAEEYAVFPADKLEHSIQKIRKRLGGARTSEAVQAVMNKDFTKAIDIVLTYYDRAYRYDLERKKAPVYFLTSDTVDPVKNSERVLEKARELGLLQQGGTGLSGR